MTATDLLQPDKGQPATVLQLVDKKTYEDWLGAQSERVRQAAAAQGFKGDGYQLAILPGEKSDWSVVLGVANVDELSPWCLARAAEELPEGNYRLEQGGPGPAALGWILGQYRFDRYRKEPSTKGPRILLTREPAGIDETTAIAEATNLVRDMVNTPAGDMGPAQIEAAVRKLAKSAGARVCVTDGVALESGYPMVA